MTTRGANYKRRPHDDYPTPPETAQVLLDNIPFDAVLCDPCCGKRENLLKAFRRAGYKAVGSDITRGFDFINHKFRWKRVDIVTNPPYGDRQGRLALAFVKRALEVTRPWQGTVAMLLPADFDSGGSRREIFGDCAVFCQKIVLTNRIRWFDGQSGSTNHAWYIYDHVYSGRPTITYAAQVYGEAR